MCKVLIHSDKSTHIVKDLKEAAALAASYSGTLVTVETQSHVYTLEVVA